MGRWRTPRGTTSTEIFNQAFKIKLMIFWLQNSSLKLFCLSVIVGLSDAFYVDFWLAVLAEYLATFFFVFAVSGSALRWEGAPTIFQQALAAGLSTASMIQAFRSVSLPLVHANPAVSLATFITGDAGLIRMVCSVLAQMFGGRSTWRYMCWGLSCANMGLKLVFN